MPGMLFRRLRVRPTGPGGIFTRRDHLRSAAWYALVTVLLALVVLFDNALDQHGLIGWVGLLALVASLFTIAGSLAALLSAALGRKT
jgi:hypothetical protein